MSLTNNSVLSANIDKIIADCDVAHISTAASLTYATVVADSMASFTPVLTKSVYAGPEGGFAMTLGAIDVTIASAGTAAYVSFVDSSGTVLHVEDATTSKAYGIGDTAQLQESVIYVSAATTEL